MVLEGRCLNIVMVLLECFEDGLIMLGGDFDMDRLLLLSIGGGWWGSMGGLEFDSENEVVEDCNLFIDEEIVD